MQNLFCLVVSLHLCLATQREFKFIQLKNQDIQQTCRIGSSFRASRTRCVVECSQVEQCSEVYCQAGGLCQLMSCTSTASAGSGVSVLRKTKKVAAKKYGISCQKFPFFEALKRCKDSGGKLAEPMSLEELKTYKTMDFMKVCPDDWFWINVMNPGGKTLLTQNQMDGTSVWNADRAPDKDMDTVAINKDGTVADFPQGATFGALCEFGG